MSPKWAEYLKDAGHDAVHWTALGASTATDSEIVRRALDAGYVILTRDLDFGAYLAASGAALPSVIQFRGADQFPQRIGIRVLRLVDELRQELAAGAFVTVDLTKTRFRLLPLKPPQ